MFGSIFNRFGQLRANKLQELADQAERSRRQVPEGQAFLRTGSGHQLLVQPPAAAAAAAADTPAVSAYGAAPSVAFPTVRPDATVGGDSLRLTSALSGAFLVSYGPAGAAAPLAYDGSGNLVPNRAGLYALSGNLFVTFTDPLPASAWFRAGFATASDLALSDFAGVAQAVVDMTGSGEAILGVPLSYVWVQAPGAGDVVYASLSANFGHAVAKVNCQAAWLGAAQAL